MLVEAGRERDPWPVLELRHKLGRRRRALLFGCSTECWPVDLMHFIPVADKSHVGRLPEIEKHKNTKHTLCLSLNITAISQMLLASGAALS